MNENTCDCPLCGKSAIAKEPIGIQYFKCIDCGEFIVDIDSEAHEAFSNLSSDRISEIQTQIRGLNGSKILAIGLMCGVVNTESKNRSQYNVVGLFVS